MIRSLVLFVHITGVLTMFAALALDAFDVEPTGRAPRMFGLAGPLTLLSGLYMGARFGVLGDAWMCASYAAIVMMAAAGPLARRSDALRQLSLRVRVAFGLAIVFLMVAKPDAVVSLAVLGLALGVSTLVGLPIGFKQPSGLSSTEA
jgi:class 3 adenylate cyclase